MTTSRYVVEAHRRLLAAQMARNNLSAQRDIEMRDGSFSADTFVKFQRAEVEYHAAVLHILAVIGTELEAEEGRFTSPITSDTGRGGL